MSDTVVKDITLDEIVEKTKRMLGKNYRGDENAIDTRTTAKLDDVDVKTEDVNDTEADVDTEVDKDTPENQPLQGVDILTDVCEMVIREAAEWTNRKIDANFMRECWPVIVKCSCVAYMNRGAEGLGSQSELGQQNVFNDWVALLHKQLTNRRYVI